MDSTQPIGVFDSGLGGLTVLKALRHALPHEDFVYLGDLARLPYGTKSESCVTHYSETCIRFLVEQNAKAIVVACGTASALAMPHLLSVLQLPIFGVIEPTVESALTLPNMKKIVVLATDATARSEVYQKQFLGRTEAEVTILGCPLLVGLAECGWWKHPITESVIREYLKDEKLEAIDAICLACTHFPLLIQSFRSVLDPRTQIVESGPAIAQQLKDFLIRNELLNSKTGQAEIRIFTTDKISPALPILRFLEEPILSLNSVDLA